LLKTCPHENGEKKFLHSNTIKCKAYNEDFHPPGFALFLTPLKIKCDLSIPEYIVLDPQSRHTAHPMPWIVYYQWYESAVWVCR